MLPPPPSPSTPVYSARRRFQCAFVLQVFSSYFFFFSMPLFSDNPSLQLFLPPSALLLFLSTLVFCHVMCNQPSPSPSSLAPFRLHSGVSLVLYLFQALHLLLSSQSHQLHVLRNRVVRRCEELI